MNTTRPMLAGLLLATLLPACSDSASFSAPGTTAIAVTGGDAQTGVVGQPLPLPLQLRVQKDGKPEEGLTVTWATSSGNLAPTVSLTDTAGIARSTWQLGATPGPLTATATVVGMETAPVNFRATAVSPPPVFTMAPSAFSDNQTGVVGTTLLRPLQVIVLYGNSPSAGVSVTWHVSAGTVSSATSLTDPTGVASVLWTLPTPAGNYSAQASVNGAVGSPAHFAATAIAGPAAAIRRSSGDGQILALNRPAFAPLTAEVTDKYGNITTGGPIRWSVVSGPVVLLAGDTTSNLSGQARATFAPTGTEGTALVRATLSTGATADFSLTVGPADVLIHYFTSGPLAFSSAQNGSSPAVDTALVGETVTWDLEFDYDNHGVGPVGSPSFTAADFPYANPSQIHLTFSVPGTYQYNDPYYPGVTGTLVVK